MLLAKPKSKSCNCGGDLTNCPSESSFVSLDGWPESNAWHWKSLMWPGQSSTLRHFASFVISHSSAKDEDENADEDENEDEDEAMSRFCR
ncbi:hypothetical protein AWZ03_006588 [Drosophila navojoa]|uniref:Uncharacterized protein n=1 Tax=Drosophila navojoa TaxID=7232 RepID=A0A484BDS5_DRONA|nr:hypothetical protein AWZ03_006588 [Drosophila navojoa]